MSTTPIKMLESHTSTDSFNESSSKKHNWKKIIPVTLFVVFFLATVSVAITLLYFHFKTPNPPNVVETCLQEYCQVKNVVVPKDTVVKKDQYNEVPEKKTPVETEERRRKSDKKTEEQEAKLLRQQEVEREERENRLREQQADKLRRQKEAETLRRQQQEEKIRRDQEFEREKERQNKIRQQEEADKIRRKQEEAELLKQKNVEKERREREKYKKNVESVPDPQPKKLELLDQETMFQQMNDFAEKKGLTVVKGDFETCLAGRCRVPRKNFVHEWQLKTIAKILEESAVPLDLEGEFYKINKFTEFSKKYGRAYFVEKDFKVTYSNFRKNSEIIEKHNKDPNRMFNMDYTLFSDIGDELSTASLKQAKNLDKMMSKFSKTGSNLGNQVIHVDWRKEGVVSDVINQGECGSCWAVASVDVFNSFVAIKNKDKTRYSIQQLLDCVSPKYNCKDGGNQEKGLHYIKDNNMCTDEEYKYVQSKQQCTAYKCEKESGIKNIRHLYSEDALDFLKKNGPFVTLFYVSIEILLYGDGIFNGSCQGKTAHSVVVVGHGYDKEKKKNYWIVKNSWGSDWGEDGYFRILDEPTPNVGPNTHYCDFTKYGFGIE